MEWLTDILSGISGAALSTAGGGVFGFIGSAVGSVVKYFQVRQQQKFEEKKWKHELKLIEIEQSRAREEDSHELAVISQQGTWSGLGTSIQSEIAIGETYKWVNAVRALFRPMLTLGLIFVLYYMYNNLSITLRMANPAFDNIFSGQKAGELMTYIVNSTVFSASTSVVWWFGDRAFSPPGGKNR